MGWSTAFSLSAEIVPVSEKASRPSGTLHRIASQHDRSQPTCFAIPAFNPS